MTVWSRVFAGTAECLADARKFTFAVLSGIDRAHAAVHVVHELAANAIQHTASGKPGGTFVLHVATSLDQCRVQVDDQGGPKSPSLCEATEEDESGRGLTIVAMWSQAWGVSGDETSRSVWAEIAYDSAAARLVSAEIAYDPAADDE